MKTNTSLPRYVKLDIASPMHRTELCTVANAGPWLRALGPATGLQRLKEQH
jgi:hypothetical protein